MIANLADALVVINEQTDTIEKLRDRVKTLEWEINSLLEELEDREESYDD